MDEDGQVLIKGCTGLIRETRTNIVKNLFMDKMLYGWVTSLLQYALGI